MPTIRKHHFSRVVPSLHRPSLTKKNITTRARAHYTRRDSFPRVTYIYIYKKTFNASSFAFVGWSFVLLKETHRRSKRRRRKKSSTDDRKHAETSLRFCSKFTCIDFFARARFSLSRAALSREEEEEKKKKHKEEQNDTETTVRKKKTKKTRGKEERETTTSSSPLSRRATLGTENCRFIFHLGFSN